MALARLKEWVNVSSKNVLGIFPHDSAHAIELKVQLCQIHTRHTVLTDLCSGKEMSVLVTDSWDQFQ